MKRDEVISAVNVARSLIVGLYETLCAMVEELDEPSNFVYDLFYRDEEDDQGCAVLLGQLDNAMVAFVADLEVDKDLPEGTLVMCKAAHSKGWMMETYIANGKTYSWDDDRKPKQEFHKDWEYVIPMKCFEPSSPYWTPSEEINYAHFKKSDDGNH